MSRMRDFSLSVIFLLSVVYMTSCSPRIPENSEKTEGNLSNADQELPSPDEIESVKIQLAERPGNFPPGARVVHVGKRGWNNLSNMWGKRGWNNLSNMWGKRENPELPPYWDKRGWNNLSNMWGKRGWNNLSNVWGKRDWNKLSNVWGKRGWNNLSNVWGKRNNRDDGSKRTTQWNNLKSVWGKRDAEWDVPEIWDSASSADGFSLCFGKICARISRTVPDKNSDAVVYVPDQM